MSIDYNVLPLHKGTPRKTLARRQQREEDKVKREVRAKCVERDGRCRIASWEDHPEDWHADALEHVCEGPSEWAHFKSHRRSKTIGQAPETRHTTAASAMLCQLAHDQYDGRQRPALKMTRLTRRGADGPLRFTRGKS